MNIIKSIQARWRNGQKGAVLVLTAFLLPAMLAFCGFAVDGGNAYYHKSKLQNSVDAAAIAGGYKYAEKQNMNDVRDKVEDYMDLNQGDGNYKIVSIDRKNGNAKDSTRITVAASEDVPVYFIGPVLRFLSKGSDHSADTWHINANATAEITKTGIPKIFQYMMIGGSDKICRTKEMGGLNDIKNSLVFHTADIDIKGAVHANGSVYLDDTFFNNDPSKHDYYISADSFSCVANKDSNLWSNYRDNYWEHYADGKDSVWDNTGHQTYYDTKTTTDTTHIRKGHENDEKVITGSGDRDFNWRYYYRMGTSDGKDITAQASQANKIDISLSQTNPMTSALYETIELYRSMSMSDKETQHVYIDTDGNYTRSKSGSDTSYQLNPSHTTNVYPGLTCGSFKNTHPSSENWKIWDDVYKIIIVDGDLQVNIPENQKPDNATDHLLFVSLHGNISVQSSSPIYGFFYAPQGTVLIDGRSDADIVGSIVAQSIMCTTGGQRLSATHSTFVDGSKGNSGSGSVSVRLVNDD